MCAAPGSKTAQLLEAVNSTPNATGVVVANDSDLKRAQLLVHQIARLPSAGVMVTNLDASRVSAPSLPRLAWKDVNTDDQTSDLSSQYPKISLGPKGMETFGAKTLEFDRILCDVPCVVPTPNPVVPFSSPSSGSLMVSPPRILNLAGVLETARCARTRPSGRNGALATATACTSASLVLLLALALGRELTRRP